MELIKMFVGFDQREAVAYHTFCQSIIDQSSRPVSFTPLALNCLNDYKETHSDGSNSFIYSRFLVPYLCGFSGWAIFADGDMICKADIAELWSKRDPSKAVQVVQHEYKTKAHKKYLGNVNQDYPRKNWSSVILWNCAHEKHKILMPQFLMQQTGAFLHRFSWLSDDEIGALEKVWNWLVIEYESNAKAKLLHYTLGTPCFADYRDCEMSQDWHQSFDRLTNGMGD